MNIYHQNSSTHDSCCDGVIPSSEFSALLNLVIPSIDVLLPPLEMVLYTFSPQHKMSIHHQNLFDRYSFQTTDVSSGPISTTKFSFLALMNLVIPSSDEFSPSIEMVFANSFKPIEYPSLDFMHHSSALPKIQKSTKPRPQKPKSKCEVAGCNTNQQVNGKCIRHGGGRRCKIEGCIRGAQTTGRCKRHGGGTRCKVESCMKSSQGGGLCRTHGGGKLCSVAGCKKGTQRQGKCATHASKKCSVDGWSRVTRSIDFCRHHKQYLQLY